MKILSLSGFVPECICDTVRFTGYMGDRNISHYCGYASDFVSQVLYDNSIDGAVYPKSCDSTRIMNSYLDGSGKFLYQIPVPTRHDDASVGYLAAVFEDFEKKIRDRYHLDEIDIEKRIMAINHRNGCIRALLRQREHKSFYSMLHSIHKMLQKPLLEQDLHAEDIGERKTTNKRIYVIGSFLANVSIIKIMEECGLSVVGDDLPEVGRLASSAEISTEGNLLYNAARSFLTMRRSPTQVQFQNTVDCDVKEIIDCEAKGAIFITQKYCEAYDYYYYCMKNMLDKHKIPVLHVTLSDSGDEGKARLQIEAFADMI